MHHNFWNSAKNKSSDFSYPCLIEGISNFGLDLNELKRAVYDLLDGNHDLKRDTRFFIDGDPKHDISEISNITKDLLSKHENLAAKSFKNRFCLVLNKLDRFHEILPKGVTNLFDKAKSYFDSYPSFQIILFLGNYGFTPFGFHRDGELEVAVHFNLGPCEKEMYTLDAETFVKLTGAKETCKDLNKVVPHAEKHIIPPNSAFILPTKYYHIGNTEKLSLDIVLLVSRFSFKEVLFHSMESKIEEIIRASNLMSIIHPNKYFYSCEDLDEAYSIFSSNFESGGKYLKFTFYAYLDYIFSSYSNNNYQSLRALSIKTENQLNERSLIYLNKPFRLYAYINEDNKICLFARRRKVTFEYCEIILNLINVLNKSSNICITEFLCKYPDKESKIIKFIKILSNSGTITIEESNGSLVRPLCIDSINTM